MRQNDVCGILLEGGFENDLGVGHGTGLSAFTDQVFGFDVVGAVQQQNPELLMVQVGEIRPEVLKGINSGSDLQDWRSKGIFSSAPEFERRNDSYRLGLPDPLEFTQVGNADLTQAVQVVLVKRKYAFAEIDGTLVPAARSDEDGDQFGIAQMAPAMKDKFLPRAIGFRPGFDVNLLFV